MACTGDALSMTLEDAAVLVEELKDKSITEDALRAYEANRGPRLKIVLAMVRGAPFVYTWQGFSPKHSQSTPKTRVSGIFWGG
jgi:2-polyprenyl-6-methoxyphenol hydroxylase-like FAD-dependent oxidoreductase